MADLGLSNLAKLKARILPADFTAGTTYDTRVTQVGRGVARAFEKYCNRTFGRVVGEVDEFHAQRSHWILQRYPVESVASITQRDDITNGFVDLGIDTIVNRDDKAGLIKFGGLLGSDLSQVRVTYTGGLWYDTAESGDTALPAGATLLHYDIEEAYFLMCERVWSVLDKQGAHVATAGGGEGALLGLSLAGLEKAPEIKAMLEPHRRMAIT